MRSRSLVIPALLATIPCVSVPCSQQELPAAPLRLVDGVCAGLPRRVNSDIGLHSAAFGDAGSILRSMRLQYGIIGPLAVVQGAKQPPPVDGPVPVRRLVQEPIFSPDGRTVAFTEFQQELKTGGATRRWLCFADSDGRRTACFPDSFRYPQLSLQPFDVSWEHFFAPDGSRLFFEASTRDYLCSARFATKLDGTGLQNITRCGEPRPIYSPDGGRVATITGPAVIEILDLRTGSTVTLPVVSEPGMSITNVHNLSFSQDGSGLLYTSTRANIYSIYFYDLKRGTLIKAVDLEAESVQGGRSRSDLDSRISNVDSSLSPDGKLIVFTAPSGQINPTTRQYDATQYEIFLAPAGGQTRSRLTNDDRFDRKPVFTADGSRVVFLSTEKGRTDVCVLPVTGNGRQCIAEAYSFSLSPDGRRIVFSDCHTDAPPSAQCGLYMVNADGSGLRRFANGAREEVPLHVLGGAAEKVQK